MKLQILPNWCKKLGLAIFIIFSFIVTRDQFLSGWYSVPDTSPYKTLEYTTPSSNEITNFTGFFGVKTLHYINVFSIFGILIYILSKEKIEDDYINQLRLESYQLTAIITIVISILLYAFVESIKLTPDYFITLFMYFYLITFFIKKRVY